MVHEQPGGQDTQVLAGEAGRGEKRTAQGTGQGLNPGIAPGRRGAAIAQQLVPRHAELAGWRNSVPASVKRVGPVVSSWSAQRHRSCPRRG